MFDNKTISKRSSEQNLFIWAGFCTGAGWGGLEVFQSKRWQRLGRAKAFCLWRATVSVSAVRTDSDRWRRSGRHISLLALDQWKATHGRTNGRTWPSRLRRGIQRAVPHTRPRYLLSSLSCSGHDVTLQCPTNTSDPVHTSSSPSTKNMPIVVLHDKNIWPMSCRVNIITKLATHYIHTYIFV